MYAALVSLAMASQASRDDAGLADRASALAACRQQIAAVWGSMSSLTFKSAETFTSNTPFNQHTYTFAMSDGGRFAMKGIATDGTAVRPITEVREDGRKSYRIVRDETDEVLDVTIDNAASSAGHYKGIMCDALWAALPAGKFLSRHLKDGATLSIEQAGGREVFVLNITGDDRQIRCELDPEHDFLVKRISEGAHGRIYFQLEVEHYQLVSGHWFPERGWTVSTPREADLGREQEKRFEISELAINTVMDSREFGMPPLPKPTKIRDVTLGTTTYEGDKAAYTERNYRWAATLKKPALATEIKATQSGLEAEDWISLLPLLASGVGLLGLAVVFVRRHVARAGL